MFEPKHGDELAESVSVDGDVKGYCEVSFMTMEGMGSLSKKGTKILFGASRERQIDIIGQKGFRDSPTPPSSSYSGLIPPSLTSPVPFSAGHAQKACVIC